MIKSFFDSCENLLDVWILMKLEYLVKICFWREENFVQLTLSNVLNSIQFVKKLIEYCSLFLHDEIFILLKLGLPKLALKNEMNLLKTFSQEN